MTFCITLRWSRFGRSSCRAARTLLSSPEARGSLASSNHLRQSERYGPTIDAADLADINELLSGNHQKVPDAIAALSAAHVAGAVTDAQVVGIFARQVARQTEMLRPVMGVLAQRHFDPLT